MRVKTLSRLHRLVYEASGGRIAGRLAGMPVLLLTTVGKSSGAPRTVPLTYFEEDGDLVLVASYGGRPQNPAWFQNLLANPEVWVQIRGDRCRMRARQASPVERARLWPRIVETYDGYRRYQEKSTREIPLAVLTD